MTGVLEPAVYQLPPDVTAYCVAKTKLDPDEPFVEISLWLRVVSVEPELRVERVEGTTTIGRRDGVTWCLRDAREDRLLMHTHRHGRGLGPGDPAVLSEVARVGAGFAITSGAFTTMTVYRAPRLLTPPALPRGWRRVVTLPSGVLSLDWTPLPRSNP